MFVSHNLTQQIYLRFWEHNAHCINVIFERNYFTSRAIEIRWFGVGDW